MPKAGTHSSNATIHARPRVVGAAFVCPDCGLLQHAAGAEPAQCPRCARPVDGAGSLEVPFALAVAALVLLVIANAWPLITIHVLGSANEAHIVSGAAALAGRSYPLLGGAVLCYAALLPAAWLGLLASVLGALLLGHRGRSVGVAFRVCEELHPWAMLDVFLLGAIVALTRLQAVAAVEIGPGAWALAALVPALVALELALSRRVVWETIRPGRAAARSIEPGATPRGCAECALPVPAHARRCPRCAARLHHRTPASLARSAALVLAGYALYVPANLLPVMTIVRFGRAESNTILGGVRELFALGMWPIGAVVLVASFLVPVLKLAGMTWLLVATWRGSDRGLAARTQLYRAIDVVGRWSNIDVFMLSLLCALLQFGILTTVEPGLGAVAFAGVVAATMAASRVFDPRLMWDAAEARHGG